MTHREHRTSSRHVTSKQTFASRDVERILSRYSVGFRKPIPLHTTNSFHTALAAYESSGKSSLILDAGCGTGVSTEFLARTFPKSFVLGVDKSAKRLEQGANSRNLTEEIPRDGGSSIPSNFAIFRAELMAFLQLAYEYQLHFDSIFFLYPNPWPKKSHMKRRVHLWPVAPLFPKLTAQIVCRTNWPTFAIEFARSMRILGFSEIYVERNYSVDIPLSLFEKKYVESGHKITNVKGYQIPNTP